MGVMKRLKCFPEARINIFSIITSYHILTVFCDHRECSFLLRGSRYKKSGQAPETNQRKGHFCQISSAWQKIALRCYVQLLSSS